jgi:hypothetical protein
MDSCQAQSIPMDLGHEWIARDDNLPLSWGQESVTLYRSSRRVRGGVSSVTARGVPPWSPFRKELDVVLQGNARIHLTSQLKIQLLLGRLDSN